MEELIRLRHELHRHPELSGQERETGKRIRFYLNLHSPDELFTGIAGEGMAAIFKAAQEGPTLLFRCELDGLPIHETSNTPHASNAQGVSHACGHDGHMAIVSGLAQLIKTNPLARGKVILFYQPEEENGAGALKSVRRLRELNLTPDFAFAVHNMPKFPLGSIIIAEHTFAAASKGLIVRLIGRSSHAAYPEKGINPSMAVAEIIQGLSQISITGTFSNFVLITIVHVRVGDIAFGTSPGFGEVMCTLRAFADSDMKQLTDRALHLARTAASKHDLAVETLFTDDYPSAVCDPMLTKTVKEIAIQQEKEILIIDEPNRWSEDFSHFMVRGPGIIIGLGAGERHADLHSPDYDFPNDLILPGIEFLDSIISYFLRSQ